MMWYMNIAHILELFPEEADNTERPMTAYHAAV